MIIQNINAQFNLIILSFIQSISIVIVMSMMDSKLFFKVFKIAQKIELKNFSTFLLLIVIIQLNQIMLLLARKIGPI